MAIDNFDFKIALPIDKREGLVRCIPVDYCQLLIASRSGMDLIGYMKLPLDLVSYAYTFLNCTGRLTIISLWNHNSKSEYLKKFAGIDGCVMVETPSENITAVDCRSLTAFLSFCREVQSESLYLLQPQEEGRTKRLVQLLDNLSDVNQIDAVLIKNHSEDVLYGCISMGHMNLEVIGSRRAIVEKLIKLFVIGG